MIDVWAIATNGYIAIEQQALSIAVDGYYPSDVITVITPPLADGYGRQRSIQQQNQKNWLIKEDEDIITIIISYLQTWH